MNVMVSICISIDSFNPSPPRPEDIPSDLEYSPIPDRQPDPLEQTINEVTQDEIESSNLSQVPHNNTEENPATVSTKSSEHTLVNPDEDILR